MKILKYIFSQVRDRDSFLSTQVACYSAVVGVAAGLGAVIFRYLIGFFQNLIFHKQIDYHLISPAGHQHGAWVILIPMVGFIVVSYIIEWFASEAKGHGVPEVIEAVMNKGSIIRKRVVAIKALASSITIATGGSVGREGPIVQIGSASGSAIGQFFKLSRTNLKTLVGCGAAGAIAATFNTPIAGVIFAVELIVLELKPKSFVPLVISSVFASVVARSFVGYEPAFLVPEYTFVNSTELVFYLILGVLAGFIGALVIKVLYAIEDLFDNADVPFIVKPALGGLIIGSMGYFYPQIFGVGYETVSDVLQQHSTFGIMFALIFLKIFAMSITLASGGSGGVFAPSLFIGAMLGGAYGYLIHFYFPDISAGYGAYALVGMAAVFAATSRATLTAIVILFEMTLDYPIILPLMFVCVISDQVAIFLTGDNSIYSLKLKRKGLNFINDMSVDTLKLTPIRAIMTKKLEVLEDNMNVEDAYNLLQKSNHAIYPVVNSKGILMGIIQAEEIDYLYKKDELKYKIFEKMRNAPQVVYEDEMINHVLKKIEAGRDPRVLVVNSKTRKLVGIVTPSDFLRWHSLREQDRTHAF
ncbi:MAG: chloride channel protein [Halobacteriovoraceae bacterium]|nr:chloride channel protein [Halobacteriovoraceae bacterium]MCB9095142.1 chloride channel protein [Halobacteriovoraceae bacterium]